MRDAPDRLRADVLVVPHHGSRTSSTQAFVRAVEPRIAVVGCGYRNRFGHPRAGHRRALHEPRHRVVRTDLEGAITIDVRRTRDRFTRCPRARSAGAIGSTRRSREGAPID